jgi:ATP synthase I chain
VEPAVYIPVSAAANLRRAVIVSAVLGLAAVVLLSVAGHPLMGIFGVLGLALGVLNNRLLQRSVVAYAQSATPDKRGFRRGVLVRLLSTTLIAVGCAVLVDPDGLAVFAGLAVFQAIMLVGAAVPVFRSLRPSSMSG